MKTCAGLLALLAAACAAGQAAAAPSPPLPAVDAPAWVVEDGSGQVLASHDPAAPRAIASITKLMTVLVVLGREPLTRVVTVDPRAAAVGEESIYLWAGEQLTVADLVRGALIQSANDAAVALALSVSPSMPAFAELMNAKAAQLGLAHTHFVRPDGLDAPDEYSTAADVTTLARDAMRVPFVRQTVAERTAAIAGGRVLHTWNDLLGVVPGVIGVKTGHTDRAGWCEVAAERHGSATIYVTVLGSPSREQNDEDLQRLLAWGVAQFVPVEAIAAGRPYAQVALPYGRGELPLVAASPLRAIVRSGRPLTERVVAARGTSLPVRRGQVLGHVEVLAGTRLLGRRALVAARSVPRPGVGSRAAWYASRGLHDLGRLL